MDSSTPRHLTPQEKRKLRKLTLRVKHLSEEHAEAEFLKSEYDAEFQLMASELRVALGIDKPKAEEPKPEEPSDISQNFDADFKKKQSPPPSNDEKEKASERAEEDVRKEIENTAVAAPSWMKRVYKQIAMETHPDKVDQRDDLSIFEQAQRVGQFGKARKALVDQDGSTLLQIAEELSIDADIDVSMKIDMMNSKISSLQEKVKKIYRSPPWIWGESYGNPSIRIKLLEGYCRILKYQVPDKEFLINFVKSLDDSNSSE